MKKHVVRAILLNSDSEVLLGKRVKGVTKGKWHLIGGVVEAGETPERAIIREVREEVGVAFSPTFLEVIRDTSSEDDSFSWDVHVYHGRYAGVPCPKEDEVSGVTFVSADSYTNLEFAYNHADILARFFENRSRIKPHEDAYF